MNKNRTLAIITLLLLIIVACVLLRATALSPSEVLTEETGAEVIPITEEEVENNDVTEEGPAVTPPPVAPKPPVVVTPAPVTPKACYVGGCSSQICSENPDVISTCEWRESYACYQTATCERQQTGECGWTETPALNSCLLEAKSNTTTTF
jgi:hypothetical protein